jgi:hypothetical protein
MGGFVGNFVFSLADHAGNGFYFAVEWVPVAASAIAIGFLCVPLVMRVSRVFIDVSAAVLILDRRRRPLGIRSSHPEQP